MKRIVLLIAAVVAAAVFATGCGPTHSTTGGASAKASINSALANPTVSSDLSAAEQALLTNLQNNFNPAHPVKSVEAAIQATYPHGSTHKIETYAVKTFTPAVMTTKGAGSARDKWLQGVDKYAQSLGGTAAIPGATP